ncbi:hypothetical protein HP439_10645 [Sphingobacterium shayense]|uniref:hypothetical protein n=1 Tax=Sphingobacterium shayense TaxID=626343 RepID=UPI001554B4E2|nr:hypothetical protein [Sphingobacterium shayense]NQD71179.1 hypothetical protein [Sphingobacterium shayense]
MNSKQIKIVALLLSMSMILLLYTNASAQCAMCSLNAQNSTTNGNTQGNGLNDGILFLLAIPYLIAIGIGILWYTKYRKSSSNKISSFEK